MTEFSIANEYGETLAVSYEVVCGEENEIGMKYGISAMLTVDGEEKDRYITGQRFFTYTEAKLMAEVMCRHNVLPCTIADILMDLDEKY